MMHWRDRQMQSCATCMKRSFSIPSRSSVCAVTLHYITCVLILLSPVPTDVQLCFPSVCRLSHGCIVNVLSLTSLARHYPLMPSSHRPLLQENLSRISPSCTAVYASWSLCLHVLWLGNTLPQPMLVTMVARSPVILVPRSMLPSRPLPLCNVRVARV